MHYNGQTILFLYIIMNMLRETLKYILTDQRQETARLLDGAILRRHPPGADEELGARLATVITGVRRCGKSVYAHQLCKGSEYVALNFDDERLMSLGPEDFDLFLQAANELSPGVKTLLMDEIQNVPNWELFINRLLRKGYRCVITGSNARLLSRELATHLTGRTRAWSFTRFRSRNSSNRRWTQRRARLSMSSPQILTRPCPLKKGRHATVRSAPGARRFPGNNPRRRRGPGVKPKAGRDAVNKELHSGRARYLREPPPKYPALGHCRPQTPTRNQNPAGSRPFALSSGRPDHVPEDRQNLGLKSVTTVKKYLEALEEVYLVFQSSRIPPSPKKSSRQARKLYPSI